MKKNRDIPWLFWIELIPLLFMPFAIWWSITATNILNASANGKLLEFVGILSSRIIGFSVLPLGIAGLALIKTQNKLRMATKIISIVNLIFGILLLTGVLTAICLVVFKGFSV